MSFAYCICTLIFFIAYRCVIPQKRSVWRKISIRSLVRVIKMMVVNSAYCFRQVSLLYCYLRSPLTILIRLREVACSWRLANLNCAAVQTDNDGSSRSLSHSFFDWRAYDKPTTKSVGHIGWAADGVRIQSGARVALCMGPNCRRRGWWTTEDLEGYCPRRDLEVRVKHGPAAVESIGRWLLVQTH